MTMEERGTIRLNRTWNAIRNMIFGIINKAVTLIFPFILRTILIKVLGMQYAGLDGLFVSVLEVLNLSELGLSTAIVYCMYKPIAHGDKETICALLKFFRKMYFSIGIFVLVIGIVIMPFLKCFIKDTCPADINLYLLYFIYLMNSCISYFFMGYKGAILSAHQRLDVTQNISTLLKGAMYIVQIVILILFGNYYVYAIMLLVFTVAINLLTAFEAGKIFPQYVCRGEISRDIKNDLKEKVSGLMITKLCAVTRNSFDSIFISAFIGLTVSAIYSNYYFIMKSIISILGIIVKAVLAGVGNSIQTETVEQNYNDLKRFNFMYLWISGVCTACLFCLYQPFMCLWMGKDNLLPSFSVVLFCVYFFLLTMGDMQSVYYNAAGLWWNYRKCTIVEALLNLVLNFILGKLWGLNGIIAGTLISLFLINFLYAERLVFKYYFKNGKALEFYLQQIKYAVVTAIVCFITYEICNFITRIEEKEYGIGVLVIRAIVCLVLSNLVYLLAYRRSKEFQSTYRWIKGKIGNFSHKLST